MYRTRLEIYQARKVLLSGIKGTYLCSVFGARLHRDPRPDADVAWNSETPGVAVPGAHVSRGIRRSNSDSLRTKGQSCTEKFWTGSYKNVHSLHIIRARLNRETNLQCLTELLKFHRGPRKLVFHKVEPCLQSFSPSMWQIYPLNQRCAVDTLMLTSCSSCTVTNGLWSHNSI